MIEPYKTLFLHPTYPYPIYLDSNQYLCINVRTLANAKNIRKLTTEEYLNLKELQKNNLHIPYILSLLNE